MVHGPSELGTTRNVTRAGNELSVPAAPNCSTTARGRTASGPGRVRACNVWRLGPGRAGWRRAAALDRTNPSTSRASTSFTSAWGGASGLPARAESGIQRTKSLTRTSSLPYSVSGVQRKVAPPGTDTSRGTKRAEATRASASPARRDHSSASGARCRDAVLSPAVSRRATWAGTSKPATWKLDRRSASDASPALPLAKRKGRSALDGVGSSPWAGQVMVKSGSEGVAGSGTPWNSPLIASRRISSGANRHPWRLAASCSAHSARPNEGVAVR